jgi:hypothetical protein
VRDDIAALTHGAHALDGGRAPVFALVAAPSSTTADWITRMRRPYENGTVVLVGDEGSTSVFEVAGWTCIRVDPESKPADVWPLVAAGSHGGARVH